jgi:hypothetical protein
MEHFTWEKHQTTSNSNPAPREGSTVVFITDWD